MPLYMQQKMQHVPYNLAICRLSRPETPHFSLQKAAFYNPKDNTLILNVLQNNILHYPYLYIIESV